MIERVGPATVTLTLDPDPPITGNVRARVHVSGVSAGSLARTSVRFQSEMSSMNMPGPVGDAGREPAFGDYSFEMALGMAAPWALSIRFSGALEGTATYRFSVVDNPRAAATNMNQVSTVSIAPWRTAVFALVVLLLLAAFVLRRDRRPITMTVFAGAGVLVLVLAVLQSRYATPTTDMNGMSTMNGNGPAPVTFAIVRSGHGGVDIPVPGTVAPYFSQEIVTRAPGILQNFTVYAGDRVSAGQVLATLDAPELGSQAQAAAADAQARAAAARAAQIEAQRHAPVGLSIAQNEAVSARTDLASALADQRAKSEQVRYWNAEIAREQTLYREGAVAQQELQNEQAQAAAANSAYRSAVEHVTSMQQQVQAARSRTIDAGTAIAVTQQQAQSAQGEALRAQSVAQAAAIAAGYRTVLSPSDGVVVKRLVDPGVYVQSGTPVLRIAVVDRLRIDANVAQEDLSAITIGTPLEARLANGKILRGRVSSIAPAADPTTHTAQVEAVLSGTGSGIPPGGYVRVVIHGRGNSPASALQVPSAAVVGGGPRAAVWIDNGGTAHRVAVQVISDNGSTALVKGSLARGARVVVDGAGTLEEGQAIAESRP